MSLSIYVNGTDLDQWADTRTAQDTLPQLIRRLVHATDTPVRVNFPSGDAVSLHGWDGILFSEHGNAFVPKGLSAWEMGCDQDILGKANKDYIKRTQDPLDIDPTKATFIFITPRKWKNQRTTKDKWVKDRNSEGKWREVRAYDAVDLEQWLEIAPSVHVWISAKIGKPVDGVKSLAEYWNDWQASLKFPLPIDFLISGREMIVEKIHHFLANPGEPFYLQADTQEEALLVLAGSVQKLSDNERERINDRTLLISDASTWEKISEVEEPLILIPGFDDRTIIRSALKNEHQIFIPLGRNSGISEKSVVHIPPINRENAEKLLTSLGILSDEEVVNFTKLARKSFAAFSRTISILPDEPRWGRPENAPNIVPFYLIGLWDSSKGGDREVLEAIGNTTYDEIEKLASEWCNQSDPPIKRIGNIWSFISRKDYWEQISRYFTRAVLEKFKNITIHVLTLPDPVYDFPEDKRWSAAIYGISPKYSKEICKGLTETLAIMGSMAENNSDIAGISLEDFTNTIVFNVLEKANSDWKIWASLSNDLQLFAEAAPDVFLQAVEKGLQGEHPILSNLFLDADGIFSTSPHVGLLWALETLAWCPDYLDHVAFLLAELENNFSLVRTANKPINSLIEIFLPWYPHTTASIEQRLSVLSHIRENFPEVSWKLLGELLPGAHTSSWGIAKPHWREWNNTFVEGTKVSEQIFQTNQVIEWMISDVGYNGSRWKYLIEDMHHFPKNYFNDVMSRLEKLELDKINSTDQILIRDTLGGLIFRHRTYPDADWALPKEIINEYEKIYRRFDPQDLIDRYKWLFDETMPNLLEGRIGGFEEWQHIIFQHRTDALFMLYKDQGFNGIIDFSQKVRFSGIVGDVVGRSDLPLEYKDECELIKGFLSEKDGEKLLAKGFCIARMQSRGEIWGEDILSCESSNWSPRLIGKFLSCFVPNNRIWEIAKSFGKETDQEYWLSFDLYRIEIGTASSEEIILAVNKLIEYGRPYSAADLLVLSDQHKKDFPPEILLTVFEHGLDYQLKNEPILSDIGYIWGELLKSLQNNPHVDTSRLARLEWSYLLIIERINQKPKALLKTISENPDFFVDIICAIYRAESEEPKEITEEERYKAELGYKLLHSWRIIPGLLSDGKIDKERLCTWIDTSRKLLIETGRLKPGDQIIGHMLSSSPADPDGIWPLICIRELLEKVRSEDIEDGMVSGVINMRGVISRTPGDEGIQERELATQYTDQAELIVGLYPRTARILKKLSTWYMNLAIHETQDDEIREVLE